MDASFEYTVEADEVRVGLAPGRGEIDSRPTWAEYISEGALLVCPHAKKETLTQYEIDLGLGTPVTAKTMQELLKAEYDWFDKVKRRNSDDGVGLSEADFRSFGFSLVLATMQTVFSNNPNLLVELLKLPVRATFTDTEDLADVFQYKGYSLIDEDKMARLLRMLRRDLDGTMPMDQYRALLAMQRLEKVRAKDPHAETHKRGHYVGLAPMHEPLPLHGQVSGSVAVINNITNSVANVAPRRRAAPAKPGLSMI